MRDRPRPRITREQIAEIRRLRSDGLKLREIAMRLGISINSASRHGQSTRTHYRSHKSETPPVATLVARPSLARLMAGR
jgi:DNA invertase Pin-like site-specific DNA recombinase